MYNLHHVYYSMTSNKELKRYLKYLYLLKVMNLSVFMHKMIWLWILENKKYSAVTLLDIVMELFLICFLLYFTYFLNFFRCWWTFVVFTYLYVVLRMESSASHTLGKCSTPEAPPSPIFSLGTYLFVLFWLVLKLAFSIRACATRCIGYMLWHQWVKIFP